MNKSRISIVAASVSAEAGADAGPGQTAPQRAPLSQEEVQATLKQYCVTCHNQRVKTANLELDSKDLAHLEKNVVAWETVVRKRTGMMPPKNASRPDRATLDGMASWLESGWTGRLPSIPIRDLHRCSA